LVPELLQGDRQIPDLGLDLAIWAEKNPIYLVLECMMKLSLEQVQHIAELARLALSDEELALYQGQLSAILEHFEQLQALDTEAIPPTATVLPLRNVMRADESRPPFPREDILANAPDAEDGCFKVPAVLE
jgi:aspartyl-tRNA(Asn)/glutamyl-tRNA(Gln) amidotransferase subunit C